MWLSTSEVPRQSQGGLCIGKCLLYLFTRIQNNYWQSATTQFPLVWELQPRRSHGGEFHTHIRKPTVTLLRGFFHAKRASEHQKAREPHQDCVLRLNLTLTNLWTRSILSKDHCRVSDTQWAMTMVTSRSQLMHCTAEHRRWLQAAAFLAVTPGSPGKQEAVSQALPSSDKLRVCTSTMKLGGGGCRWFILDFLKQGPDM